MDMLDNFCEYCGWIEDDGAVLITCVTCGKSVCQNCRDADALCLSHAPMDLPARVEVVTEWPADFEVTCSRYDLIGAQHYWVMLQPRTPADQRYFFTKSTDTPHEGAEAIKLGIKEILKTRPGTMRIFLRSESLTPWFLKKPTQ